MAVSILKKIGFTGGSVHPCLYMRNNYDVTVYVALCINDNLIIGDHNAIDHVIIRLEKKWASIEVENNLTDYFFCNIMFKKKVLRNGLVSHT